MIRFVDLNTGNTFNGQQPYIFWFDGQQSTNIWYSQPICFISNSDKTTISLNKNDIFQLVDPEKISTTQYTELNKIISENNSITLTGKSYHNFYIYIVYIIGCAKHPGEYIEYFSIDDEVYKIGADFYQEEESLYINLSNMGVDIPETIQKSLYKSNLREDHRDNILLNRKWKELLSNYWDTIACKGSTKSLFNTLKWFEYGDLLKISEVWKSGENELFMTDLKTILVDKYKILLDSFVKSTYLSISCALEHLKTDNGKVIYDDQLNPVLEKTVFDWSINDMALKMCLLGSFYETYFLPIHLDLIHCTIEDVVYTNTFKDITSQVFSRKDLICDYIDIECNIKDGDIFHLDHVKCYAGPNTYTFKNGKKRIGVQRTIPNDSLTDKNIDFVNNMYNGIGLIIDFNFDIPLKNEDKIKKGILYIKNITKNEEEYFESYKLVDNIINISLLFKEIGDYELCFQFNSIDGNIYTKKITFKIDDYYDAYINLYRLVQKTNIGLYTLNFTENAYDNYKQSDDNYKQSDNDLIKMTEFGLSLSTQNENEFFKQYIPVHPSTDISFLNHVFIIHSSKELYKSDFQNLGNYNVYCRVHEKGVSYYYICICNKFGQDLRGNFKMPKNTTIIREDFIFIPEYYNLKPFEIDSLSDCTLNQNEFLCVIPNIKTSKKINDKEYEWVFINESLSNNDPNKKICFSQNKSVRTPFTTPTEGRFLSPGYYSIELNYSFMDGETKTIKLNSAFRVK